MGAHTRCTSERWVSASKKASGRRHSSSCSKIPKMVPVGMPASTLEDPSRGSNTVTYFAVSTCPSWASYEGWGWLSTCGEKAKKKGRPVQGHGLPLQREGGGWCQPGPLRLTHPPPTSENSSCGKKIKFIKGGLFGISFEFFEYISFFIFLVFFLEFQIIRKKKLIKGARNWRSNEVHGPCFWPLNPPTSTPGGQGTFAITP